MVEIMKLSIGMLVGWFVAYLFIHIGIAILAKSSQKKLAEKPGNEELEHQVKIFNFAFKWFPVIALIIVLIVLL